MYDDTRLWESSAFAIIDVSLFELGMNKNLSEKLHGLLRGVLTLKSAALMPKRFARPAKL